MIYYRRRNSNEPLPPRTVSRHPLLTYCNWSHHRSRHIDEDTLRDMLTNIQERYFHIYLRMINETPRNVVDDFIEQNNLNPQIIRDIYQELDRRGLDLVEATEIA